MNTITLQDSGPERHDDLRRFVRPRSARATGTALLVVSDSVLRQQLSLALWSVGVDVEQVGTLERMCSRLHRDLASAPDVLVWDDRVAQLVELEHTWRNQLSGLDSEVVLMTECGEYVGPGLQICGRNVGGVVDCVLQALSRL
jgi:hypothetical protein